MNVKRIVVCAAIKIDGVMVCGARHYDKAMRGQLNRIFTQEGEIQAMGKTTGEEQGFIDQFSVFMGREEALEVAKEAGQIGLHREKTTPDDILFSEDLY